MRDAFSIGSCARDEIGHAAAAPPMSVMNSRRDCLVSTTYAPTISAISASTRCATSEARKRKAHHIVFRTGFADRVANRRCGEMLQEAQNLAPLRGRMVVPIADGGHEPAVVLDRQKDGAAAQAWSLVVRD